MPAREAVRNVRAAGLILLVSVSVLAVQVPAHAGFVTEADTVTDLEMDDFGTMVIDGARNQLIVSGGMSDPNIKFVNFDGTVTGTIGIQDGPSGMVIVGSTLYFVENGSGQISPVDLTNNDLGAPITSSLPGRYMLGYAGGSLWTSSGDGLDRIDPATGSVTTFIGDRYPSGATTVDFATDPSDPARLAVVADGATTTLRIYDATAEPPTRLAGKKLSAFAAPRFTPDGSSIVVSTETSMTQLSATDLTVEHTYPGVHPNGTTFVWCVDAAERAGQVYLAELTSFGTTVFAEMNDDPVFSTYVAPFVPMRRGIAFSPSGNKVFVVSRYSTGTILLHGFDDPTLFGSTMTISARERVPVFRKVRMSGQLIFDEGTPVPAGVPVEIWHQTFGSAEQLVSTVTTSAGGAWSAEYGTDAGDIGGDTFTARFDGDAEHRGSSAQAFVAVNRIKRELTLTASKRSITLGDHVRLTVNLELDHHDGPRDVRIMRDQNGNRRLIGIVTVDDTGVGSLRDAPTRDATYEAIVLRDQTHTRSVSNLVHVTVSQERSTV
jgi:hypothetical protein